MGPPKHLIQRWVRLRLAGSQVYAERVAGFWGAQAVDQLQRLAGAVLKFLQSPAANDSALIGKFDVIDGGIERERFFGGRTGDGCDRLTRRDGSGRGGRRRSRSRFRRGRAHCALVCCLRIAGLRIDNLGRLFWLKAQLAIDIRRCDQNDPHQPEGKEHADFIGKFFSFLLAHSKDPAGHRIIPARVKRMAATETFDAQPHTA